MDGFSFDVTCSREGRAEVITASGEIDIHTGPRVQEAIDECLDRDAEVVVLDFGDVRFIDSTGVAMVLRLQRKLAVDGHRFAIACDQPRVKRVFELSGLDQLVVLETSLESALDSVT